MTNALAVALVYLTIFGLTEILRTQLRLKSEITRKVAHVASGLVAIPLPFFLTLQQLSLLAGGFFILLLVSRRVGWLPSIHQVSRTTLGAIFFPIAVLVVALLTWPHHFDAYVFAMLTMALADTAAAIFGRGKRVISRDRLWEGLRGTFVFFVTTSLIIIFIVAKGYAHPPMAVLVVTPFLLGVIERYSPYGSDNLTVPISAALLWML